jgi:hypothetical protein
VFSVDQFTYYHSLVSLDAMVLDEDQFLDDRQIKSLLMRIMMQQLHLFQQLTQQCAATLRASNKRSVIMDELMHEHTHVYVVTVLFQGGQQEFKVPLENPLFIFGIIPARLGQHSEDSFECFSDLILKRWLVMEL